MAAPKRIRERIAKVRYHLQPGVTGKSEEISEALDDPAVRNYLDTWVMPELDALADWAAGRRGADGGVRRR